MAEAKNVISSTKINILGIFKYENKFGFEELPKASFDVPEKVVKELEDLTYKWQACDRAFAYAGNNVEREALKKEWLDLQIKLRETNNRILYTYGAECTEYFELDNPYRPHVNFVSKKLIIPLANQKRYAEAI